MDRTENLYKNRHLANCKFKFPDERVLEANKTLLSFYSPVFDSMFFGDLSESQTANPIVEIVDADYEIFDKFLMYIYTKKIEIEDVIEAESIFYLARKYEILELEYTCLKYIRDGLSPDTVFLAYEISQLFDDVELKETSMKVMRERTVQVLLSKDFLHCDINTLLELVSQKELNITSELELFKSLENWSSFNDYVLEEDKRHVQQIQFLRMDQEEFISGPMKSQLLTDDEKVKIFNCLMLKDQNEIYEMPEGFTEATDRICIDRSDENIFKMLKEIRESRNPPFFECSHYKEASITHIIMKCDDFTHRTVIYELLGPRGSQVYEGVRDTFYKMLQNIEEKNDKESRRILCNFIRSCNIDLKYLLKVDLNDIQYYEELRRILSIP